MAMQSALRDGRRRSWLLPLALSLALGGAGLGTTTAHSADRNGRNGHSGHSTAVTPVTALANSATDPSGQPMPVGNLPGWTQKFSDDFRTSVALGNFPQAVSSKWKAYPDGWHDTSGNGTYKPSRVVSIQNGVMNLHVHTENGVHMVSAPEPVIPGATGREGGQTYGRYAMRFRADAVPGYKTAWLLWPDSENWSDGEIDFPEGDLTGTVNAFMHHKGNPTAQDGYSTAATYGAWHTAVVEWTPQSVKFSLDGSVIGTSTNTANIPSTPMHWVLQTETALSGGAPADSAAGDVQIDWVTAYSGT
jgi:beta-glucanase (GH16 family)